MSEFKIKITGRFVIAQDITEESQPGKLIVTSPKKDAFMKVVSTCDESSITCGDKILINAEWNKKFVYKDEEYYIIPLDNIVGVIH